MLSLFFFFEVPLFVLLCLLHGWVIFLHLSFLNTTKHAQVANLRSCHAQVANLRSCQEWNCNSSSTTKSFSNVSHNIYVNSCDMFPASLGHDIYIYIPPNTHPIHLLATLPCCTVHKVVRYCRNIKWNLLAHVFR